jgi:hypothetical protein
MTPEQIESGLREWAKALTGHAQAMREEPDTPQQLKSLAREWDDEAALLTAAADLIQDKWPNLTHQMRDKLLALVQQAGVNVQGKWLSEAACEAIENPLIHPSPDARERAQRILHVVDVTINDVGTEAAIDLIAAELAAAEQAAVERATQAENDRCIGRAAAFLRKHNQPFLELNIAAALRSPVAPQ